MPNYGSTDAFLIDHLQKYTAPIKGTLAERYPDLHKSALVYEGLTRIAEMKMNQGEAAPETYATIKERAQSNRKSANTLLSSLPPQLKEPAVRVGELRFILENIQKQPVLITMVDRGLFHYGIKGKTPYEKIITAPDTSADAGLNQVIPGAQTNVANGRVVSGSVAENYNVWEDITDPLDSSPISTLPNGEATGDEIAFQTQVSTATPSQHAGGSIGQTAESPYAASANGLTPASYDEGAIDSETVDNIIEGAEEEELAALVGDLLPTPSYAPPEVPFYKKPAYWGLGLLLAGGAYYIYKQR